MKLGTLLGAYEILELLGAGGMGEVCRARDTRLDRHVAVKILLEDLASDPVWSPDGARIFFSSTRDGLANVYWKPSDGRETLRASPRANRRSGPRGSLPTDGCSSLMR